MTPEYNKTHYVMKEAKHYQYEGKEHTCYFYSNILDPSSYKQGVGVKSYFSKDEAASKCSKLNLESIGHLQHNINYAKEKIAEYQKSLENCEAMLNELIKHSCSEDNTFDEYDYLHTL